jgi:catechol 2,3-dioxygenase-like lactoylglutathione lyase family enzyme
MTTMATESKGQVDAHRCGCCGRTLPSGRVTELGTTPGVYICGSCAVWAARRSTRMPVVRLDPRLPVQWLRRRVQTRQDRHDGMGAAIPILPSADLDRTAAYYQGLGLKVTGRYDGYLVLNAGSAEMHFSSDGDVAAPGHAFLHVADARRLWKQLKDAGVAGIGPVEDQPHGLREFVATDPDGNRIRVGSPIHDA